MGAAADLALRRSRSTAVAGGALLLGFCVLMLAAWAVLPLLARWEVPKDNLEQIAWALTPDWGYTKHPPFPTWVLWVFQQLLPRGLWLTYALGAAQVGMMLLVAHRLVAELQGRRAALVAVLLIGVVTYYTRRLSFYNHNTALLVAHAVACFCVWRALVRGGAGWWWLLGLTWGLGLLSKYQMVLTIACNLAWLALAVRSQPWRSERADIARGVVVAGAVALACILPHVVWLAHHGFPTFDYASHSLAAHQPWSARPRELGAFFGNQLGRLLPAAVLAAALLFASRHRAGAAPAADASGIDEPLPHDTAARLLLPVHAFGPFVLMGLLSLLAGVDLQMHWGTAFLWLVVPALLAGRAGRELARVPRAWLYGGTLLVHALTALVFLR